MSCRYPPHRQAILSQGEPRDTLYSAELLPTETERKKEKKMKKKKTFFKRIATRPKALALRAQHRGWPRLAELTSAELVSERTVSDRHPHRAMPYGKHHPIFGQHKAEFPEG